MNQCLAPCVLDVPPEAYAAVVRRVELILAGRAGELLTGLRKEMLACSARQEYERAAALRDQIRAVEGTVERQAVVLREGVSLRLAVAEAAGGLGLAVLFVRQGRLLDSRTFHWPGLGLDDAPEAVAGFLTQFYWATRFIPERILLPWTPEDADALAEALAERRGGPVRLAAASSGPEKQLLEIARANAAGPAATPPPQRTPPRGWPGPCTCPRRPRAWSAWTCRTWAGGACAPGSWFSRTAPRARTSTAPILSRTWKAAATTMRPWRPGPGGASWPGRPGRTCCWWMAGAGRWGPWSPPSRPPSGRGDAEGG
jgi:hypothetical protein